MFFFFFFYLTVATIVLCSSIRAQPESVALILKWLEPISEVIRIVRLIGKRRKLHPSLFNQLIRYFLKYFLFKNILI
jgi:hypothetical protein